jgi:NAD(P)H-hydrate epimerase
MANYQLTRTQVRDVDRRAIDEFAIPGVVLMENAGLGCVKVLQSLVCNGLVAIVCGKGNNAGDGFVIARHLDNQGVPIKLLLLGPPDELQGDAGTNFTIAVKSRLPLLDFSKQFDATRFTSEISEAEWIVDALLGTGSFGAPRPPMDQAIRLMNEAKAKRMAVDLPSGLDCDTGEPAEPTFRAHHTCTFVAKKTGFDNPTAAAYLGQIHIVDIGAPRRLIDQIAAEHS